MANISIRQAAKMLGVSETEIVETAPDSVTVNMGNLRVNYRKLPEYQKFEHLHGKVTWAGKASKEYGIANSTISRWASGGIIRVVGSKKNRRLLDAQDVAYCAYMHKQLGTAGRATFTGAGLPNIKE